MDHPYPVDFGESVLFGECEEDVEGPGWCFIVSLVEGRYVHDELVEDVG